MRRCKDGPFHNVSGRRPCKRQRQLGVLACYHQALVYILEISEDTRNHFSENYDRKEGSIQTECLRSSWQTSGSLKAVRLAFNLYTDGAPSADECEDPDEQIAEDLSYAASDIFCCRYAVYFMQGEAPISGIL